MQDEKISIVFRQEIFRVAQAKFIIWAKVGPLFCKISKEIVMVDLGYSSNKIMLERTYLISLLIWLRLASLSLAEILFDCGKLVNSISSSHSNFEDVFLEWKGPKLF